MVTAGSGPQIGGAAAASKEAPKFRKIEVATGLGYRGSGMLSPDGQQLAYVSDGALWVAPVHGKTDPNIAGAPKRLTEAMHAWDSGNVSVSWSVDGKWIGFRVAVPTRSDESAVEELYVISAEGGDPKRLPIEWKEWAGDVHTLRYALSAGAETLYFAAGATQEALRIYSMPATGGPWKPLTEPMTREPALSPDRTRLAYVRRDATEGLRGREIWVKDLIDGTANRICRVEGSALMNPALTGSPVWSPDGRRLAFTVTGKGSDTERTEIRVAAITAEGRLRGEPARFLLPHATRMLLAGWTSDGKIGFLPRADEEVALYAVPAAGGKAVQLTPKQAWMPAWAPDGRRIFFLGMNVHKPRSGIESVPAGGGEITALPMTPPNIQVSYPSGGLSVSPDGARLCFAGFRNPVAAAPEGSHIFTMPVDGGALAQLTSDAADDYEPTWSPDGARIAFLRAEPVGSGTWVKNLFVIPSRGGTPQRLSDTDDHVDRSPKWSPDGAWIAYVARDGSLRVIPAHGGPSRVVLPEAGISRWHGLAWSPDAGMIAYTARRKLWRIPRDGGEPEEIPTGLEAIHMKPAWSPDGERIAVVVQKGGQYELWLMEDFEDLL